MQVLRILQTASGGKNVGFRSLSEIERTLADIRSDMSVIDMGLRTLELSVVEVDFGKGAKGVKLRPSKNDKSVILLSAPDKKSIEKNFSLVADLDEKLKAIDSILAQLAYQFKDDKSHAAVLRETKALRKDISDRIKTGYTAINKIAKGNVSSEFKSFTAEVTDALFDHLDGYYDKSTQRLFVDVASGQVRFTHYIRFEKLEDDNGHVYPEYTVALTHMRTGSKEHGYRDQFFVNTTLMFQVPGRFNPGTEVDDAETAVDVVDSILVAEGFRSILQGNDLPFTKDQVPAAKFAHISSKFKVTDTSIEFTIKPGLDMERAKDDLFLLFKGWTLGAIPGQHIQYKIGPKRTVSFFLAGDKPFKLNRTQLKVLQNGLGLTDDDVKKIQQQVL